MKTVTEAGTDVTPAAADNRLQTQQVQTDQGKHQHAEQKTLSPSSKDSVESAVPLKVSTAVEFHVSPPPVGGSGQTLPEPTVSKPPCFTILSVNVRSINSKIKRARLKLLLEDRRPDIVALTETWLDVSRPSVVLPGYFCVARRDRPGFQPGPRQVNHGGVAVYRRCHGPMVTHLGNSVIAERAWLSIHTKQGPILSVSIKLF